MAISVLVTVIACLVGTVCGAVLGWVRYRCSDRGRLMRIVTDGLPSIFKSIPILVMLVWMHYAVPVLTGIELSPMWSTIIILGLSVTVSSSEIIRAGIVSIPRGEFDAAYSLGVGRRIVALEIGLPLAFRASFSGLLLLYIDTLKLSTLGSIIALPEALHSTDVLIQHTYIVVPSYTLLAIIFILVVLPLNWGAALIGEKIAIRR